jgi:DNA sulfur modification protein DndD
MIRFESLLASNFALYPQASLQFSVLQEKPLTLIRGENESGKTTLMRAFVWGLFGEGALPRMPEVRHPVRPVWAKPGERLKTKVEIRFRSDTDRAVTFFKLIRSAETDDDGGQVTYGEESIRLLRREGDEWVDQEDQLTILMLRYFRPEMQDFYFIDADKAVEFAGGPEGRHNDQLMRASTTQAIRALLGLEIMLKARDRLEERAGHFSREAGSRSSDKQQRDLAHQLEEKQGELENAKRRLAELRAAEEQAEEVFRAIEGAFNEKLSTLEQLQALTQRLEEVGKRLNEARTRRTALVNTLSQHLDDDRMYGALMLPAINHVMSTLQPLKDKGYIPPAELTLLPRLLERGQCVCGLDLATHPDHRRHIEQSIHTARATGDDSSFLDSMLESARRLGNRAMGHTVRAWKDDITEVLVELSTLDPTISTLEQEHDALREEREKGGAVGTVREMQKHRDSVRVDWESQRDARQEQDRKVEELHTEVRSLGERIRIATAAEQRTQEARNAAQAAEDLRLLIGKAYEAVERDQVKDVSAKMNGIFRDVIGATEDSLFGEVGVRPARGRPGKAEYEVFVTEEGREKPLALANGASRRAIGVSFVLALAEETRTRVPFVADSLLHAMSGSVRQRIVGYLTTGDRVGQPVLFGTRADFLDPEVKDLLKARAGRSYTLTCQAHVGRDVVRATPNTTSPKQVVVCECQVDEFCEHCERAGDRVRVEEGRLFGPRTSVVV